MSQPVHFIAHLSVNDADRYRVYEKGFFPILKAHGGRFVTYDDAAVELEGDRPAGRTVIIQFENEDQLMGWWDSAEYQELAEHRRASCTTHSVTVVHPLPPRD